MTTQYLLNDSKHILKHIFLQQGIETVTIDNDCISDIQIQYCIRNTKFNTDNDSIIHIFIDNHPFFNNVSFQSVENNLSNEYKCFFGHLVYTWLYDYIIQNKNIRCKIIFHGLFTIQYYKKYCPVLVSDIELNNFFQVNFKTAFDDNNLNYFSHHPQFITNLWKGRFLNADLKIINKKILLIDDEILNCIQIYNKILPNADALTIDKSNFYDESVIKQKIEQGNYDLIILDLYLTESHLESFESNPINIEKLSGIDYLATHLNNFSGNIIVFTSSNKIWTFKKGNSISEIKHWVVKPNFDYTENRNEELKYYYNQFMYAVEN
jgi:hypothetical protein